MLAGIGWYGLVVHLCSKLTLKSTCALLYVLLGSRHEIMVCIYLQSEGYTYINAHVNNFLTLRLIGLL